MNRSKTYTISLLITTVIFALIFSSVPRGSVAGNQIQFPTASTPSIISTPMDGNGGDLTNSETAGLLGVSSAPSGFNKILSDTGVALYKKDYTGGKPDFVQVVSLNQGASVKLLHGAISAPRTGKGPYGGNDPTFKRISLSTAWSGFVASNTGAFCITNGQFFADYADKTLPTPLAFSLKKDGVITSDGYAVKSEFQNPYQLLMLEIWGDHADIRSLTESNLENSSAPNILGGLSENANKGMNSYVGRTFAGIDDSDGNGSYETILIFNSSYARQVDATNVLRAFGADKVIMFDGGGSTQLNCKGSTYISSSRTIPQTIGVVKGNSAPPLSCTNQYKAEYFNNKSLSGSPSYTRCENWPINWDWGSGGPGNGIGNDNFSARWTGQANFNAGNYTFIARSDDGVRVWLDGTLIIDKWFDQGATEYRVTRSVSTGNHSFKVEYYENGGGAVAQFRWEQDTSTSTNIALNKPTWATSQESSSYPPYKGNDGNTGTRWSSGSSGDQWWRVDLGSAQTFDKVIIRWEAAYAATHWIAWSNDDYNYWYYSFSIPSSGSYAYNIGSRTFRYVAVIMKTRAPCCGNFSFWEFEVYRTTAASLRKYLKGVELLNPNGEMNIIQLPEGLIPVEVPETTPEVTPEVPTPTGN